MKKLPIQVCGMDNLISATAAVGFAEFGKIHCLQSSSEMKITALLCHVLCDVVEWVPFTHESARFCFGQNARTLVSKTFFVERVERHG
jgi:hypothetical protein